MASCVGVCVAYPIRTVKLRQLSHETLKTIDFLACNWVFIGSRDVCGKYAHDLIKYRQQKAGFVSCLLYSEAARPIVVLKRIVNAA